MCNRRLLIVLSFVLLVHCAWSRPNPKPVIDGIVFRDPSEARNNDEEVITPPVLPVLDHLENDPSTLLPRAQTPAIKSANKNLPARSGNGGVKPRFGFSNAFDVSPNPNGGLTASFSNGYSGLGGHSQAASHSLSFGFKQGFQASHSSSQSASFNNGFPGASFSGSQASSQSANFNSQGFSSSSSAAASSAALAGASISASSAQSQSAVSSFGQNSGSVSSGQSSSGSIGNSFGGRPSDNFSGSGSSASAQSASVGVSGWTPNAPSYGENNLDIRQQRRHRGRGDFVFPSESTSGHFQSSQFQVPTGSVTLHGPVEGPRQRRPVDWLTSIILSD